MEDPFATPGKEEDDIDALFGEGDNEEEEGDDEMDIDSFFERTKKPFPEAAKPEEEVEEEVEEGEEDEELDDEFLRLFDEEPEPEEEEEEIHYGVWYPYIYGFQNQRFGGFSTVPNVP